MLPNKPDPSDAINWYAVRTHSQQETRVEQNLGTLGIETLIPRVKKRRHNGFDELTSVIKPFFPGYIFARFDIPASLHKVRMTRGVHSVICYGTTPAQVDAGIIGTIQSRMGEGGCIKIGESLKPGDEVIIEDGPLKDFTGMFERETGDAERVMILLRAVTYQAHLVIEKKILKRVG